MAKWLLALGGLGVLGAVGVFRARSNVARSRTPWLRVHDGTEPPSSSEQPVLWLALATISPSLRSSILDEVEAAMASAEARANPLLVDLVEDDVGDVFRRNQGWFLPLCTAASALLASSYDAPDGFRVRVLAANAPRGVDDIAAWKGEQEDARARRARFLAWPASRSLIIRARSKDGARAVEADLRNACPRKESAIALVLDPSLAAGRSPESRLDRVLVRLAKAPKSLQTDDIHLFPQMPTPGKSISPWVVIDANELLVIPKLSAVSPPGRFTSEIHERLRGTDCDIAGGGLSSSLG